jgi:hypothetical protein
MTSLRTVLLIAFFAMVALHPGSTSAHGSTQDLQRQPVPCGPTDC